MMRLTIAIFLIFLLTACHTRTADDAYKEGKYLESISLLTTSIEEKGESKFDKDSAEKLRTLVSNITAHYETSLANTAATDYQTRIDIYQSLLKMKMMLRDRFYSQTVSFFNDKYNIEQLEQTIAKQYYDYGNSITGTDSQSYLQKATLYQKGLEHYNYKNIQTLYQNANTKYMQVAAKEFYDFGKKMAQDGQYKNAAEAFSNASQVYQPLGKYKDSDKLFTYYDKKYRTQEAENFYRQGEELMKTANRHATYRQAAEYYSSAASIYRPYGAFRDASYKAQQCAQRGVVTVNYRGTIFDSEVRSALNSNYISFYGSNPDVIINITQKEDFSDSGETVNNESKSETIVEKMVDVTDDKGNTVKKPIYKEQKFNLKTITHSNRLRVTTYINVSGAFSYSQQFDVEQSSSKIDYIYSGDVPHNYHNQTKGTLETKSSLANKIQDQQRSQLKSYLSQIAGTISSL
ncbi:hypothetical protein [Gilliamella sp. wkB171]|uniref:hypothetical protein n=1 Tax=Gilliamella sp. wkB171 TaxID=3120258 RepID=UPI0015CEF533|nr:hypothetical protein [Gilliamella apicola]